MRDISTKVNDSAPAASGYLDAAEFNASQTELENAVAAAGLTLDPGVGPDSNLAMLAQSMTRHASAAVFCIDSGAANAYVVSLAGPSYEEPTALFLGLRIEFVPGAPNTTASTCNAFGLGSKAIVDYTHSPLASGAIDGKQIVLYYRPDIGAGSWLLPRWADARYVAQTPASPPSITAGEGWTVNVSNQGDLNFQGLTNEPAVASSDVFAFHDVSASHHRGITWAQMLAAMAGGAGGGLVGFQVIQSSGTYTPTSGTGKALVFAIGGGGGGGGGGDEAAGGGAGGVAISLLAISGTVVCTIGAGGTGAASGRGGTGGTTLFGASLEARGGLGGTSESTKSLIGEGGVAVSGTLRVNGGAGTPPSSGGGGSGGCNIFGGGGRGGQYHTYVGQFPAGQNGSGLGGGGGGGDHGGAGGSGAAGGIVIIEFAA